MSSETATIAQLANPSHSSFIYQTSAEQTAVTCEFLARGLTRGELCVFLESPERIEAVREALRGASIDVAAEEERGALILSSNRAFLDHGHFSGARAIAFLEQTLRQALAQGFSALRATGDMNWELGEDQNFELLLDYEAELDRFVRQHKIVGLCQYRRHSLSGLAIRNALETHEQVVLGRTLCSNNLYYEPPEIRLNRDLAEAQEKRIERMCQQLEKAARMERQYQKAITSVYRENERLNKPPQSA
jgi:hypothetical protein